MYKVIHGYTGEAENFDDLDIAFRNFFENVTEDEDIDFSIYEFIDLGILMKGILNPIEQTVNISIHRHKLYEI